MDWDERYSAPGFAYGTGGPQSLDMLMSLDDLKRELAGWISSTLFRLKGLYMRGADIPAWHQWSK